MKKIKLSQGLWAKVGNRDFKRVDKHTWSASWQGVRGDKVYAIRWYTHKDGKREKIWMHRFILGLRSTAKDPQVVHHKNDDGLDNQRKNLEVVENSNANMARSRGWNKKGKAMKRGEEPWL